MGRIVFLLGFLLVGVTAFAQSVKVPDYVGFYGLNIPGFQWEEGAQLSVHYRRVSGYLDLDHTSRPVFEADGLPPIALSLDQTSRLLLVVNGKSRFDLVGLEGSATGGDGNTMPFFVVFLADVNGKQVNLIPTLTSKAKADNQAGPGAGGPGGGPGGGGVTSSPTFSQKY